MDAIKNSALNPSVIQQGGCLFLSEEKKLYKISAIERWDRAEKQFTKIKPIAEPDNLSSMNTFEYVLDQLSKLPQPSNKFKLDKSGPTDELIMIKFLAGQEQPATYQQLCENIKKLKALQKRCSLKVCENIGNANGFLTS